eukprot:jgi/Hompol1/4373/HPOL_003514-RA
MDFCAAVERMRELLSQHLTKQSSTKPGDRLQSARLLASIPWSWTSRRLIDLLQQYPGGLTLAIMHSELTKLWLAESSQHRLGRSKQYTSLANLSDTKLAMPSMVFEATLVRRQFTGSEITQTRSIVGLATMIARDWNAAHRLLPTELMVPILSLESALDREFLESHFHMHLDQINQSTIEAQVPIYVKVKEAEIMATLATQSHGTHALDLDALRDANGLVDLEWYPEQLSLCTKVGNACNLCIMGIVVGLIPNDATIASGAVKERFGVRIASNTATCDITLWAAVGNTAAHLEIGHEVFFENLASYIDDDGQYTLIGSPEHMSTCMGILNSPSMVREVSLARIIKSAGGLHYAKVIVTACAAIGDGTQLVHTVCGKPITLLDDVPHCSMCGGCVEATEHQFNALDILDRDAILCSIAGTHIVCAITVIPAGLLSCTEVRYRVECITQPNILLSIDEALKQLEAVMSAESID